MGARHVTGAALEALLIAAIIALVALAMSGFYQPAGFIAGVDNADAAGRTSARITIPDGVFGGTTTATANPGGDSWVYVACYRSGERVLGAYERVNSDNQATFRLGPTPSWASGAAHCVGQEGYWSKAGRWRVLAETTFEVAP
jgi:hypothetical protein